MSALRDVKYRVAWRSGSWRIKELSTAINNNGVLYIDFKPIPSPCPQTSLLSILSLQREAIGCSIGVLYFPSFLHKLIFTQN